MLRKDFTNQSAQLPNVSIPAFTTTVPGGTAVAATAIVSSHGRFVGFC
jgi:hypothetical protein